MKKFLTLALTAVMALSLLTACGSKNDNSADTNTDGSNTETTLSGTVSTDGSTSMEKVINSLGESFMAMNKDVKFTKDACQYRQELTSTGDVINTVSQNPDAIGYASLSAVKDTVKALTVGGVAPSEDTVKDGSYVVQRPFVLVTKEDTKLSPAAQAFFDYALSADAASIIAAAGAVAAN